MSRELVVATVPAMPPGNPYQGMLEAAVAPRGVRFRHLERLRARDLAGVDVAHLHWVEFLYSAPGPRILAEALAHWRGMRLVRRLRRMADGPTAIVWTAHNLRPHDSTHEPLDRRSFGAACAAADRIVVHSHHAASRFSRRYGVDPDRIDVIPHGNYEGAYPQPSAPRERLRAELNLDPGAHALLAFGQVRDYKRLPELIDAFAAAASPQAVLVVAGNPRSAAEGARVRAAAAGRPQVRLELGHASDQRVSDLHALCDAAVLNYRDVFSSGALLLAWSLGLAVLAPAGTTADELAEPPAVFSFDDGDLQTALRRLIATDRPARRDAALATSGRYAWEQIGEQLRATYDAALARRPAAGAP